jgi:hypothetical protein
VRLEEAVAAYRARVKELHPWPAPLKWVMAKEIHSWGDDGIRRPKPAARSEECCSHRGRSGRLLAGPLVAGAGIEANVIHRTSIPVSRETAVGHNWLTHIPDLSPTLQSAGQDRPSALESGRVQAALSKRLARMRNPARTKTAGMPNRFMTMSWSWPIPACVPMKRKSFQHRDITVVTDRDTSERILEIQVRGKRSIAYCKSMPGAVEPYNRLLKRAKPMTVREYEAYEKEHASRQR